MIVKVAAVAVVEVVGAVAGIPWTRGASDVGHRCRLAAPLASCAAPSAALCALTAMLAIRPGACAALQPGARIFD
jgi:hypothetical protein